MAKQIANTLIHTYLMELKVQFSIKGLVNLKSQMTLESLRLIVPFGIMEVRMLGLDVPLIITQEQKNRTQTCRRCVLTTALQRGRIAVGV